MDARMRQGPADGVAPSVDITPSKVPFSVMFGRD